MVLFKCFAYLNNKKIKIITSLNKYVKYLIIQEGVTHCIIILTVRGRIPCLSLIELTTYFVIYLCLQFKVI